MGLPRLRAHRPSASAEASDIPRPSRPGVVGPSAGLQVVNHLSLYRQPESYFYEGVDWERSTLADWVGQSSQLLRPLSNAIDRHVISGHKVHAGKTPIGVLAPGNGKTNRARLWSYVRDVRPASDTTPAAVWFAYSPDYKGELKSSVGLRHGRIVSLLSRAMTSGQEGLILDWQAHEMERGKNFRR